MNLSATRQRISTLKQRVLSLMRRTNVSTSFIVTLVLDSAPSPFEMEQAPRQTPPAKARTTFMTLPQELRDRIYGLILHREEPYQLVSVGEFSKYDPSCFFHMALPILHPRHSSPQIVHEATQILFRENTVLTGEEGMADDGRVQVICADGDPYFWMIGITWKYLVNHLKRLEIELPLNKTTYRLCGTELPANSWFANVERDIVHLKQLNIVFVESEAASQRQQKMRIVRSDLKKMAHAPRLFTNMQSRGVDVNFKFAVLPYAWAGRVLVPTAMLLQRADAYERTGDDMDIEGFLLYVSDLGIWIDFSFSDLGTLFLRIHRSSSAPKARLENTTTQWIGYNKHIGEYISAMNGGIPPFLWSYSGNHSMQLDPQQDYGFLNAEDRGYLLAWAYNLP